MRIFALCTALSLAVALQAGCNNKAKQDDAKVAHAKAKQQVEAAKIAAKKKQAETKKRVTQAAAKSKEAAKLATAQKKAVLLELPKDAMLVVHKVKDFQKWKAAFDSNLEQRSQAGFALTTVWQDSTDDNTVIVGALIPDAGVMKDNGVAPEMIKKMKDAGVKGTPDYLYLKLASTMPPPPKEGEEATVSLIHRGEVKDYEAWRSDFDSQAQARTNAGIVTDIVFQGIENPNEVLVIHESRNIEALKKVSDLPEAKASMKKHLVGGKPSMLMVANIADRHMVAVQPSAPAGVAQAKLPAIRGNSALPGSKDVVGANAAMTKGVVNTAGLKPSKPATSPAPEAIKKPAPKPHGKPQGKAAPKPALQ